MAGKILVTYASMTGSTKSVSEAIGKTLPELGADVDIISMRDRKVLRHLNGDQTHQGRHD